MTNKKFFKMIACLIIKISTNLFSIKDTAQHVHHIVMTVIKRFLKVVRAQTVLQIEKSAGIQVVANLITVIESVSKFELAINC